MTTILLKRQGNTDLLCFDGIKTKPGIEKGDNPKLPFEIF